MTELIDIEIEKVKELLLDETLNSFERKSLRLYLRERLSQLYRRELQCK